MRMLGVIGAFLILSGCISIPLPGGRSRTVTIDQSSRNAAAAAMAVVGLEARIRAKLRAAKQRLTAGAKTTSTAGELNDLVEATRAELREKFPPEAELLLVAVESTMNAELRRLQSTLAAAIHLAKLQSGDPDAASVHTVIDHIIGVIDHLLSYDKLALTLSVKTKPQSARFELLIKDNQHSFRTVTTNTEVPNVWRGIYTATARVDGYKKVETTIDLINDGRTNVSCTLMPDANRDASFCLVR
jgi:hypothetical protein